MEKYTGKIIILLFHLKTLYKCWPYGGFVFGCRNNFIKTNVFVLPYFFIFFSSLVAWGSKAIRAAFGSDEENEENLLISLQCNVSPLTGTCLTFHYFQINFDSFLQCVQDWVCADISFVLSGLNIVLKHFYFPDQGLRIPH